MRHGHTNYLSIINPNAVEVGVPAASKEEVFEYVSQLLKKDGAITSVEAFKQDLYAREAMGRTASVAGWRSPTANPPRCSAPASRS